MHKIMKKMIVLLAVMAGMVMGAGAQNIPAGVQDKFAEIPDKPARVPAYQGMIERKQPNGYTLRTYLHGDEWKHWTTTEDGWQIVSNKKGWYVYAQKKRNGEVRPSCKKARNVEDRKACEKRWLERKGVRG